MKRQLVTRNSQLVTHYSQFPDSKGHFGKFGGRFVPETLIASLDELELAYNKAKKENIFQNEFHSLLQDFAGRPTSLYFAERLSAQFRNTKIYLKREDLCHTGAHKINNTIGQILLAKKLKKKRIVAETGAGQHGVATATVAAKMGFACVVYMGTKDMVRQEMNVKRMQLLGAEVRGVTSGTQTLKDATNEAIRDWVTNVRDTFYVLGSVVGPHPYPMLVRDFQKVIGEETRKQILKKEKRLPDILVACVGGGSNSLGLFFPFLNDDVKMFGVEAAGLGLDTEQHAATLTKGKPGVLHGSFSYLLQNHDGQILPAHSISAGLDYPGVGPEHSYLKETGRVQYVSVTDDEALDAVFELTKLEGIFPALESAHALAYLKKLKLAIRNSKREILIVVNLSGRGEKDLPTILQNIK
ncbi:MAG: tryptophan synthase subunit beta [Ignavibacteria bacterium]|nr:tryptophan synthase subunit beta [Ignavibacteria bacterium]